MRSRILVALSLLLLVAPGAALAQGGSVTSHVSAVSDGVSIEDQNLTPGQQIHLLGNVSVPERANTTWRAFLNASNGGIAIQGLEGERPIQNGGNVSWIGTTTAPQTEGPATLNYTLTVQYKSSTQNQTGNQSQDAPPQNWTNADGYPDEGQITFQVQPLTVEPAPGLPWGWILGLGALVVLGAGGAYWWTHRDRQIRGTARSQAMQDLEGDRFDQDAPEEPEVHPQAKILEARAEDIRRMIELARERYERGDLTEHQYETIRERKEAELEDVQGEIDEYRTDAAS